MQLNLFHWDLLAVGNGYSYLARLDFYSAQEHFARVLEAQPGHQAATAGQRTVCYWQDVEQALAEMHGEAAVVFFWKRLGAFSFGSSDAERELRDNLLGRLQVLMEGAGIDYLPPGLCRGYLALQRGDYANAESQLRSLIESVPGEGLLYGYLADALWLQGRQEIANGIYATALLLDPQGMAAHVSCNGQLNDVITKYGVLLAQAYGFLQRVLPLVGQESVPDAEVSRTYAALRRAEWARHRNDQATVLAARKELQALAPEVFADYLQFVREG